MLSSLSVSNYAIIDNTTVDFQEGLNVLTGETGAGKSILVGALSMALGYRSSAEMVRSGEQKASVKALFTVDETDPRLMEILSGQGVEPEDGNILISREIFSNGRNVCRINGSPVNVSALRELGLILVDIHGQHEHQKILNADTHLSLLDEFGKASLGELLAQVRDAYSDMKEKNRAARQLMEEAKASSEAEREYAKRLSEIDEANLKIGEDAEIASRLNLMKNSEKIFSLVDSVYNSLYGEGASPLSVLSDSSQKLEEAVKLDPSLAPVSKAVTEAWVSLDDSVVTLRDYRSSLEFSPEAMDSLSSRLSAIERLKRRYGETIEEILSYRDETEKKLSAIRNIDRELSAAKEAYDLSKERYMALSEELSQKRRETAKELSAKLISVLSELNMSNVSFEVSFAPFDGRTLSSSGIDRVEFLISTNAGEDVKSLTKVASGGEVSRIMLGLKSIFAEADRTDTLIFDEIDTGISGRTAQVVAQKMCELASNHQLICITHLPQIASMASNHMVIEKSVTNDRTATEVTAVTGEERTKEIARMISGVELTDVTLSSASEMLSQAEEYRRKHSR
ncbi:MAG: DNA repair protein RecN [Eubacteriales bacterium]|nr:DNA repair protein RecN [Eubacteriales bacterium]